MVKFWSGLRGWLAGKKMYLLAALVCVVAIVVVAAQEVTPATALAIALFTLGLFTATFRAALERHHEEAMAILESAAVAGAAIAARNPAGAFAAGSEVVQESAKLEDEIRQEAQA